MLSEFYREGKYWPDFKEIQRTSINIGEQVLESGMVVVDLVAVTRGGIIPMAFMSRVVNWSQTETIDMKSYYGNADGTESPSQMSVTKKPFIHQPEGKGALFVDDVEDTGETAKNLKEMFPQSKIAVVYSKIPKDESTGLVDFVGEYTERNDAWINFPWEV